MTEEAYDALESLGCSQPRSVGYRDSYVFIARKGYANNIKEKLVKHNEGFAQLEMAAAGQPLAWYWFDPGRAYDPMIGRWMSVDPMAAKTPAWTPYRYAFNNPLRFIDSNGMTEEERKKALEQAKKYVQKNPNRDKNQYELGKKGGPGEKVDCSGLASNVIKKAGVDDPVATGTGNGVTRIVNNTQAVAKNDAQEGNLVTFNNGESGDNKIENVHVGVVEKINRDSDENITSIVMIHSGTSTGPTRATVRMDGKGYWGKRFQGFHKWDTPDKPAQSSKPAPVVNSIKTIPAHNIRARRPNIIIRVH